jgi:ABC-type transport system involved in multi-copper enzyme maturation permease subunit
MRGNPILKKELVLGSRSMKFPIALMCYSAVMAIVALGFLSVSYSEYSGTMNYSTLTEIFLILSFMQLVLICIIIPVLTAGSIAGERERQTLDLLLTAPVSSVTIILGKLLSSMCNVVLFVISSLPAMALAFLYGGIQWKYLLVFLVAILVTAFFNGAIGVWCASIFKKTILSIVMTLVVEAIFFIGTAALVLGIYAAKFSALMAAANTASTSMATVQMGWIPAILFLNPATGFVDSILHTYMGIGVMHQILNSGNIGSVAVKLVDISSHWYWINFIVVAIMGVGFVFLAARRLDAVRKKEKFQQPVKKKKHHK